MKEIKQKVFYKRWFCKHEYKLLKDLRGFFGITQCTKCGKYSSLPDEEMETTHFLSINIK